MDMSMTLDAFPITGAAVCSVLDALFTSEKLWVLTDIETLTDTDTEVLGDLWRQVQTGIVVLTTSELTSALKFASQVVSLDIRLEENRAIELLIEDGMKIRCHLK